MPWFSWTGIGVIVRGGIVLYGIREGESTIPGLRRHSRFSNLQISRKWESFETLRDVKTWRKGSETVDMKMKMWRKFDPGPERWLDGFLAVCGVDLVVGMHDVQRRLLEWIFWYRLANHGC